MLHILHVTFDMGIGGAEQVIAQLIRGLDTHQYRASIYCIEEPIGAFGQKMVNEGINVLCTQRRPKLDLSLIQKIRQVIKDEKVDIVHCHQYTPYIYGLFAALLTPAQVIFTEHGRFYPDIPSFKRRLINPWLSLLTARITSISQATRNALVDIENFKAKKIEVIYNGIEDIKSNIPAGDERAQLGIEPNDIVYGTVSRLDPIKNHVMLLKAFAEIHKTISHSKLMIVGDGPLREQLHTLKDELDLGDSVIFTGFQVEPQRYLNMMDVYLLPSLSEGTSMTLLEAMSLSKPCIVTDAGGNPEIILDQHNGLVTPNDQLVPFIDALLEIGQDQGLRQAFGEQGRLLFEQKFELKIMMTAFNQLYASLSS